MPRNLDDLRRARRAAADTIAAAAAALDDLTAEDATPDEADVTAAETAFAEAEAAFAAADEAVKRQERVEAAQAAAAGPGDQGGPGGAPGGGDAVPALATDPAQRGIEVGFMVHALANSAGSREGAVARLERDGHSGIAATLSGATDAAGGVTIPRPLAETMIQLLRPRVTVRASGARTVPMPAGQLRHARQASSATASYGAEAAAIVESEPGFDAVDQAFKKLGAMVPVSNTLLRQSGTAVAVLVRDDLLNVMGLREDLAFLRNDGTGGVPRGIGSWCPVSNVISGVAATAAAAEAAIRRAVSLVEDANVMMVSPGWIMRASAKNWLASLRDANGNLIWPSIDASNTLRGFPILTTSQLPDNLGAGTNETEIMFADFAEVMIGDAYNLTIASSTEAAYVDTSGDTISAYQNDLTLMRAISEHDLAPMHDVAIAKILGVGWAL